MRVDTFKNEHKSAEMLEMNPMGTVPFVFLDGKVHTEKVSSLKFFVSKYPSLWSFYPAADVELQKNIDQALEFNMTKLRPCFLMIFKTMVKIRLKYITLFQKL